MPYCLIGVMAYFFQYSGENPLVPYSDSDESPDELCSSCTESPKEIEDETCVGKRGYKKKNPLPKRIQNMKKRNTSVQPNPCAEKKCPNSCTDKFTESDRLTINEHFWGLGNKIRQKDWILSSIVKKSVQRRRTEGNKKKNSYTYVINYNNISTKVCQQYLLKTLNISQKMLRIARENTDSLRTYSVNKKRYVPYNKTDQTKIELIKSFIEQLPAVPSHYCRNKSNKLYLPHDFMNITELYKRYSQHLKLINEESALVSIRVFRNIFKTYYHIGFHLPKKDKCITCENYKNLDVEERKNFVQTEEYLKHIEEKDKCKESFLKEQKESKGNSLKLCASFDLQKVLNTPHSKNITLFYSRKYAYYNESVYENGTRNGYCFLWGETDGKRGCSEICTILSLYLKLVDERKTHTSITLYCDSCGGQNRNKAMLATLITFLENANFIKDIKITYLLPGHTMMPVDSIHSTIESFIRNRTVWAPSEWFTMISNARTNPQDYKCILVNHSDFKDWKTFSQVMFPNSVKIHFPNLRSVFFEKNNPVICLKYGYCDNSEFKKLDLNSISRSRRNSTILSEGPLPLYEKKTTDIISKI